MLRTRRPRGDAVVAACKSKKTVSSRVTRRVRVQLDFVVAFDRDLDSLPPAQNLVDAFCAWANAAKLGECGAVEVAPGGRVRMDLDFRKPKRALGAQ